MNKQNSIFEVNKDILQNLDPERAEDVLRKLLYAEARTLGVPINSIDIPIETNAPDGGVDARVESSAEASNEGLIRDGYTCYQMKSGENFDPTKSYDVKEELFVNTEPKKENLKRWIKDCMERDGTYILISLGKDIAPNRKEALKTLNSCLAEAGYPDADTEVWGPEKIRGFLQSYPTMSLTLNRLQNSAVMTFEQWKIHGNLKREIFLDEARQERIERIRKVIRNKNAAQHVHICGQSGAEKTRLALEALDEPDLKPLVWYEDNADRFIQKGSLNILSRPDNHYSVILVIDNCEQRSREKIWKKLKNQGAEIKVITISTKCKENTDRSSCIEVPPLEDEQIKKILSSYKIPESSLEHWSEICDGSPGVAHIVGKNWVNKDRDILAPSDSEDIWKRHIAGESEYGSQQVKERRLVLSYLALFKQFGYKSEVREEAKKIHELLQEDNPGIGWAEFSDIVHYFKKRGILRGKNTLHISPKALHIKMWAEWWDCYGDIDRFYEIAEQLPSKLQRWFFDMFRYAEESETASDIAKKLLTQRGFFESEELLETDVGSQLFQVLAEATPGFALSFLERTIGEKDREELLNFKTGRRKVIRALKMITIWDEYFTRGARLLLKLGEAENESWANNASGEFAKLFSPAPAPVAPTEKPIRERLTILKETLGSNSDHKIELGLRGCRNALRTGHFSRMVGPERQGLKREPDLWVPSDRSEYLEYYRSVWDLLTEKLDELEKQKDEIIEILIESSGQLGKIPELNEMVVKTLQRLSERDEVSTVKILSTAKEQLHFNEEDLAEEVKANWEGLVQELTTDDYHFRLRKAVGNKDFRRPIKEARKKQREEIEEVAKRSIEEKEKLKEGLPWLVSENASSGGLFGRKLGEHDENFSLLPDIKEEQLKKDREEERLSFFSGYLGAIYEDNEEKWDNIIDKFVEDDETAYMVSELLRGAPLNDKTALKALNLVKNDLMKPAELQHLGDWTGVSEETFVKIIDLLVQNSSPCSKPIGLFLMDFYYLRDDETPALPSEPTLTLLTDSFFFEDPNECALQHITTDYYWNKLGEVFLERFSERDLEIAEALLSGFGEEGSITQHGDSKAIELLDKVMTKKPAKIWDLITPKLRFPITAQAEMITSWLQGGKFEEGKNPPITEVPESKIWSWVDGDTDKRPWYLATFVPTFFSEEDWKSSLARKLLVKYGHRKDVRNNLSANFGTGLWMGKESKHHASKRESLQDLKEMSTDKNVLRWINDEIRSLKTQEQKAETREERFRNL